MCCFQPHNSTQITVQCSVHVPLSATCAGLDDGDAKRDTNKQRCKLSEHVIKPVRDKYQSQANFCHDVHNMSLPVTFFLTAHVVQSVPAHLQLTFRRGPRRESVEGRGTFVRFTTLLGACRKCHLGNCGDVAGRRASRSSLLAASLSATPSSRRRGTATQQAGCRGGPECSPWLRCEAMCAYAAALLELPAAGEACVARDAPELHEVLVEMRGSFPLTSGRG